MVTSYGYNIKFNGIAMAIYTDYIHSLFVSGDFSYSLLDRCNFGKTLSACYLLILPTLPTGAKVLIV